MVIPLISLIKRPNMVWFFFTSWLLQRQSAGQVLTSWMKPHTSLWSASYGYHGEKYTRDIATMFPIRVPRSWSCWACYRLLCARRMGHQGITIFPVMAGVIGYMPLYEAWPLLLWDLVTLVETYDGTKWYMIVCYNRWMIVMLPIMLVKLISWEWVFDLKYFCFSNNKDILLDFSITALDLIMIKMKNFEMGWFTNNIIHLHNNLLTRMCFANIGITRALH